MSSGPLSPIQHPYLLLQTDPSGPVHGISLPVVRAGRGAAGAVATPVVAAVLVFAARPRRSRFVDVAVSARSRRATAITTTSDAPQHRQ